MVWFLRSLGLGLGFGGFVYIKTRDPIWTFVVGMGMFMITFWIGAAVAILRREIAELKTQLQIQSESPFIKHE